MEKLPPEVGESILVLTEQFLKREQKGWHRLEKLHDYYSFSRHNSERGQQSINYKKSDHFFVVACTTLLFMARSITQLLLQSTLVQFKVQRSSLYLLLCLAFYRPDNTAYSLIPMLPNSLCNYIRLHGHISQVFIKQDAEKS